MTLHLWAGTLAETVEGLTNYRGNPDAIVTNVDISPGIASSRTSGQCPAFVQVSASAMLGTGSISANIALAPYQDYSYEWNFGDTNGTETFTCPAGPRDGQTLNANNTQRGPEAAYVYRSPGTYTITLTVRGKTGASTVVVKTATMQFTATAFSASGGTYYFDSVSGSDANDGLSSGAPKQTITAIQALDGGADRQFYLKRGSTWTGSITVGTRQRWDAYGSGAKPIVQVTSGANSAFLSAATGDDIVISNIDMRSSSSTDVGIALRFIGTLNHVYLDNVDASSTLLYNTVTIEFCTTGCGFWKSTFAGPIVPWHGVACNQMYGGAYYWHFAVGCYFEGAGGRLDGVTEYGHHAYDQCREHSLYQWQTHGVGTGLRYCINGNYNVVAASPTIEYPQWHTRAECDFHGTLIAGLEFGTNTGRVIYRDCVVQDSDFHDMRYIMLSSITEGLTVRNNDIWAMTLAGGVNSSYRDGQNRVYGLRSHNSTAGGGSGGALMTFADTGASWTLAQQIVDNISVDERASAVHLWVTSSEMPNSLIDRNQYYNPNDAGTAFIDGVTGKTFAQWQALGYDLNGSVADPGWTDGANGDFS